MVRQLNGTIGYVDLVYAQQNNIPIGFVNNAAGSWVTGFQ
ncbi:MAG: phosphate transporter substrate-binding protein PstS [Candidatus Eremiobacteraeota bacterium]|nr:phosphate transporter substrate-binding protein PstS [Candidatus Eremiobacteraeota bacterium]